MNCIVNYYSNIVADYTIYMATCLCCKSSKMDKVQMLTRALSCPCRWRIFHILGKKEKDTNKIYEELKKQGEKFSKQGLYYHLSELEKVGLVTVVGYKDQKGAPLKIWKLAKHKIVLDLLKGHE